MLKFLGIGSAFNNEMGNTSAYIKENDNLLLIDCGSTAFSRIKELNLLDDVANVYIAITHMHSDHIGSLGTLVEYLFNIKNITPNFILTVENSSDEQELAIRNYLTMVGVDQEHYDVTYADMMEDVFTGLKTMTLAKVKHYNALPSYAIQFYFEDKFICYVGDNKDKEFLKRLVERLEENDIVYTSVALRENNLNISINELAEIFAEEKRENVYCMHFENYNAYNEAKEQGFKVVSRELSKSEILKSIANRK